ncbi:MAG TPA: hypothetical protein VGH79_02185 [Gaiellaceae bacterium]|jgi:CSLREA domain-containing protein
MKRKTLWVGVAALAAGLIFVTVGAAATTTTVTLTVNSTTDSTTPCTVSNHKSTGTCTLRGAIAYADNLGADNTMFVIKLAAKTYHLSQGTLDIDASTVNTGNIVQIVGKTKTIGKKKHKKTVPASILDGSGNVKPASVFEVYSPTQMYNVVVEHGSGYGGGGIYNGSALDIENSVITNNTACSAWSGNSCTGTYQNGGGIEMATSSSYHPILTLYKTTVSHNKAAYGGGIDFENTHHSTVYILKSHIDDNIACQTFSNGVCAGDGQGGGIYDSGETMTVESSTVNGNVAGSPAYSTGYYKSLGGGIYTDEDALQLLNTTVSGNLAGEWGGGIYDDNHLDLVNSTVSHNVAAIGGGGITEEYLLTSKSSTISGNTAGGAFACTVNGNSTTCKRTTKTTTGTCATLYPSATQCSDYDGGGGGLYADYEYPQLVGTTVTKNTAVTLSGDAANCSGGQGGGVWNAWAWTATGGSKFTNNVADCGGGIYNYWDSASDTYTLVLNNSLISGNTALTDGGGLWTAGTGTATLYGTTVTGNHAGHKTGGVWDDGLGSVLLGPGNKLSKNTSPGSCKNITFPCK